MSTLCAGDYLIGCQNFNFYEISYRGHNTQRRMAGVVNYVSLRCRNKSEGLSVDRQQLQK